MGLFYDNIIELVELVSYERFELVPMTNGIASHLIKH